MLSQGGFQIRDCRGEIAGFELGDPESVFGVSFLKMRDRLLCVAFAKQCITKHLLRSRQIGIQLNSAFERRNGFIVLLGIHVGGAQIDKPRGKIRSKFCYLFELDNGICEPSLLFSGETGLGMLNDIGGNRLPRETQYDDCNVHQGCSGSRTCRI